MHGLCGKVNEGRNEMERADGCSRRSEAKKEEVKPKLDSARG